MVSWVLAGAVTVSNEAWTLAGVCVTVAGGLYVAIRQSRTATVAAEKASLPDEVRSLGERLDAQSARIESLERKQRGLYDYIADDHDDHRKNGWPIRPLPEDLK